MAKAKVSGPARAVPANTADYIKAVATELFFKNGFKATTTRNITEACGFTPGALYNHFSSKDKLLFEIIKDTHQVVEEKIYLALGQPARNQSDRLKNLIREFVVFHSTNRQSALVANQEYHFLSGEEKEHVRQLRRRVRAVFEDILRAGAAVGEFDLPKTSGEPAGHLLAMAMIDMVVRVSEWFNDDGAMTPEQLADVYAEFAARMAHSGAAIVPIRPDAT